MIDVVAFVVENFAENAEAQLMGRDELITSLKKRDDFSNKSVAHVIGTLVELEILSADG